MILIRCVTTGEIVGRVVADRLVPDPAYPGSEVLAQWQIVGVESLQGADTGDSIVEVATLTEPDDELFGLAVCDAAERRGWEVVDA